MLKDNQIKAILFDLDGTLLDTSAGIRHSVRYAMSQLHLPQPSDDQIGEFIGPPIQESLMKYAGITAEEAQKGANIFREFYKNEALFEASLYEGILSILEQLRQHGIKIGVATYKREDYAIEILKHFDIVPYCDVIHGADNENRLSKADIIQLCCDELREDKAHILLVGDTEHDAKGAALSGVRFCAVTWGFGYRKKDVPEDICCIHEPMELLTNILR